jgi:DnaJ-class molecular chaperone
MNLKEARKILGLGLKASRKEIRTAYRRVARRWHPDRSPPGEEEACRTRMQEINSAYQLVMKFLEDYRYHLVEAEAPEDYQKWWESRFATGVWGSPPQRSGGEGD